MELRHDDNVENTQLIAWTDGLYTAETGTQGSESIIVDQNNNILESKPPGGNKSSTRPEIWAIYKTIEDVPNEAHISFNTDSQVTIDDFKTVLYSNKRKSWRKIPRLPNHSMLIAAKEIIQQKNLTISFNKVKAHIGIALNELADHD